MSRLVLVCSDPTSVKMLSGVFTSHLDLTSMDGEQPSNFLDFLWMHIPEGVVVMRASSRLSMLTLVRFRFLRMVYIVVKRVMGKSFTIDTPDTRQKRLRLKDASILPDLFITGSGNSKELSLIINKWKLDSSRKCGQFLRSRLFTSVLSAHGCECESVNTRDMVRSSVTLYGLPDMPYNLNNYCSFKFSANRGGDGDFCCRLRERILAFRECGVIRGDKDKHRDIDELMDGQWKMGVLLSSFLQWDSLVIYLGSSPGWNIYVLCEMLNMDSRSFICVDPRETLNSRLRRRLSTKYNWNFTEIRKRFDETCIEEIYQKAVKCMYPVGYCRKLLILNDIRSTEHVNDPDSVLKEDRTVWSNIDRLLSMFPSNINKDVLLKIKVIDDCCSYPEGGLLFPLPSERNLWELRVRVAGSPSGAIVRTNVKDFMEKWHGFDIRTRARQGFLLRNLLVERLNGLDDFGENRCDLFYMSNRLNLDSKDRIKKVLRRSEVCTLAFRRSEYDDVEVLDKVDLVEMSMSLTDHMILGMTEFLLEANCDTYCPLYSDAYIIIVKKAMLESFGVCLEKLEFGNSFVGCQTLGLRGRLDRMRLGGHPWLPQIDAVRKESDKDEYSGHLIGFIAILDSDETYHLFPDRWLKTLKGRYMQLEAYDDQPEMRSGENPRWHNWHEIDNTLHLLKSFVDNARVSGLIDDLLSFASVVFSATLPDQTCSLDRIGDQKDDKTQSTSA